HPVQALVTVPGQVHDRFAHRFAGNGSAVDAGSADDFALFDQGNSFAKLGALHRSALPGGAGTDDNHIVFLHRELHASPQNGRAPVQRLSTYASNILFDQITTLARLKREDGSDLLMVRLIIDVPSRLSNEHPSFDPTSSWFAPAGEKG